MSSVAITIGMRDWRFLAVACLILVGGLCWAGLLGFRRASLGDPIAALNLREPGRRNLNQAGVPVRPPVTPKGWERLIRLTPPRAVDTSRTYTMTVLVLWVLVLVNGEVMWRRFSTRGTTQETAPALVSFMLLYVMLPLWITIASIRRERAARELLRDGEVTIGCWGDGSYQFWTTSGERFEHRGAITSSATDVLTDAGLVPVFYSRDNPGKSVALCTVWPRVRIPAEPRAGEAGKLVAAS